MMRGYGYDGWGSMMNGGAGWIVGLVILAFWILVIVGIVLLLIWIVRQLSHGGHGGHGRDDHNQPYQPWQPPHQYQQGPGASQQPPGVPPHAPPRRDEACEVARMRYARGEIDKAEYEDICRTLGV